MIKKLLFLLALTLPCYAGATQYITFTSPTNGAIWHRGSTYTITWTVAAGAPDSMSIHLIYDSSNLVLDQTIKASVATQAKSFTYTVSNTTGYSSLYNLQAETNDFNEDQISQNINITITKPSTSGIDMETISGPSVSIPNIKNGSLSLDYTLGDAAMVSLNICDISGKVLGAVPATMNEAGPNRATVDIRTLPHGVYVCRLQVGTANISRKFLVQ